MKFFYQIKKVNVGLLGFIGGNATISNTNFFNLTVVGQSLDVGGIIGNYFYLFYFFSF